MPDYSKGKIYTIRSFQCDKYYIGSTIQKLSDRLAGHKRHFNEWINGTYNYVTSYEILKYDDCYIELLEGYPCNNRDELKRYEGQKIREFKNECCNKYIAGRTRKEYNNDNKEIISEKKKIYNENNKEKIKQYREDNKEHIAKRDKEYREKNKEELALKKSIRDKKKYAENKEEIQKANKISYNKHKEQRLKDAKKYRDENKDKIKKSKSIIINCQCGSSIQRDKIRRHERSKKHLKYIENLIKPSE